MRRAKLAYRLVSSLALLVLVSAVCPKAQALPSFTRQTGLACNVCHNNPPELTAFGRKFKLEGYTLTQRKAETTIEDKDLKILSYFPLSVMILLSDSATNKSVPGAKNGNVEFPQSLILSLGWSPWLRQTVKTLLTVR